MIYFWGANCTARYRNLNAQGEGCIYLGVFGIIIGPMKAVVGGMEKWVVAGLDKIPIFH